MAILVRPLEERNPILEERDLLLLLLELTSLLFYFLVRNTLLQYVKPCPA